MFDWWTRLLEDSIHEYDLENFAEAPVIAREDNERKTALIFTTWQKLRDTFRITDLVIPAFGAFLVTSMLQCPICGSEKYILALIMAYGLPLLAGIAHGALFPCLITKAALSSDEFGQLQCAERALRGFRNLCIVISLLQISVFICYGLHYWSVVLDCCSRGQLPAEGSWTYVMIAELFHTAIYWLAHQMVSSGSNLAAFLIKFADY